MTLVAASGGLRDDVSRIFTALQTPLQGMSSNKDLLHGALHFPSPYTQTVMMPLQEARSGSFLSPSPLSMGRLQAKRAHKAIFCITFGGGTRAGVLRLVPSLSKDTMVCQPVRHCCIDCCPCPSEVIHHQVLLSLQECP